jgi:MFS family permease
VPNETGSAKSPADQPLTAPAPVGAGDQRSGGTYAWYVLAVLFLVNILNLIDRNILTILAPDVKAAFALSDSELGFLFGTAFAIFYAQFGMLLGRLADRWHRVRLVAAGLGLWSVMTALSGAAGSYAQLAVARVGVGVGEASVAPAAYSLLADYFPVERRALAFAICAAGLFVGAGLSLPLGGSIVHAWIQRYGGGGAPLGLSGWQAAFLAVGIPGILFALWFLTVREPRRGATDRQLAPSSPPLRWRDLMKEAGAVLPPFTLWSAAQFPGGLRRNLLLLAAITSVAAMLAWISGDWAQWIGVGVGSYAVASWAQMLHTSDRPAFTLLFKTRAVVLALLGFASVALVAQSLTAWIPSYAIRTFTLRSDVAGFALGVPGGFAAAAGCVAGGYLSDKWKRRDPRGRLFVCMLAAILPAPFTTVLLRATAVDVVYLMFPMITFAAFLYQGSAVAAIQDCVLPRMRATGSSTYVLAVSLLGLGLGPYGAGKVAAISGSLQAGIMSLIAVIPLAVLLLWRASLGIEAAERSREARAQAVGEAAGTQG